jgi:hypothetical protein
MDKLKKLMDDAEIPPARSPVRKPTFWSAEPGGNRVRSLKGLPHMGPAYPCRFFW